MGEPTLVYSRPAAEISGLIVSPEEAGVLANQPNCEDVEVRRDDYRRKVVLELMQRRDVEVMEFPQVVKADDVALMHMNKYALSQAFFVVNLGRLYDQFVMWTRELSAVKPFYAVKCNPDPHILYILGKLGCNFDCASLAEMRTIIKLGFDADRIVFANPCKKIHHLRWARDHGVKKMTFDNQCELDKIASFYPDAELILRIATDDSSSVCRFSAKFGLAPERAEEVLLYARNLNLSVVGVSFHVGSGCTDPRLYELAISDARMVFAAADRLGFPKLKVLDIGGGFAGEANSELFGKMAAQIRTSLDEHFPSDGYGKDVDTIAEPGRFFAMSTHTLLTCVYAKRELVESKQNHQTLYVDDGVYGSFNCILYDHAAPKSRPLRESGAQKRHGEAEFETTIFGPTCDGLDKLTPDYDVYLPKMEIGDFLLWNDMGAYTCAASGYNFNGMEGPLKYYVFH